MAFELSAEKILVIGIGALGIYAVYRLVNAPKETPPAVESNLDPSKIAPVRPPVEPTTPAVPVIPTGPLPRTPGPIGTPPPAVPLVVGPTTGPTMHLANSKRYRGRLELPPGTTPDVVQVIVRSLGFDFDSIQVFSTPAEAAPNIPSFALQNPGQGTRWFHALVLDKTTQDKLVRRPPELVAMWIVARAPVRTFAPTAVSGFPSHSLHASLAYARRF